jgi:hypothetical protein
MSSVLYDLCDAARHLWRAPLLTLAVFAILAAGIGLNLAASNLIDSTYVPVSSASVYQVAD